jgi:UDP-3-O-[3-hydroxymyristoyl] glucosamine N-acyltransferase
MSITIEKIASHLNAKLIGDPKLSIESISSVENATKQQLVFIEAKDIQSKVDKTTAGAVICQQEVKTSKTLLIVKNPRIAFAKALELFDRPKDIKQGIDEKAWVEKGAEVDPSATVYPFVTLRSGAKIGKNVILYPGVYVGQNVKIQDDAILFPNVTVFKNTHIGKRVLIHAGARIGDDGFGYVWNGSQHYKIPQVGNVVIEDDVEIGANAAVDRATTGTTKVGQGTKIDNLVQIGHNDQIGKHCIICGQVGLAGSVNIGDGAMLGGQAGVADHVNIAPGARVGAQSGIIQDIKTQKPLFGTPATEASNFFKSHLIISKKLPEMRKELLRLRKEVEELKKNK